MLLESTIPDSGVMIWLVRSLTLDLFLQKFPCAYECYWSQCIQVWKKHHYLTVLISLLTLQDNCKWADGQHQNKVCRLPHLFSSLPSLADFLFTCSTLEPVWRLLKHHDVLVELSIGIPWVIKFGFYTFKKFCLWQKSSIRWSIHPPLPFSRCEMTNLPAWSPKYIQSVFILILENYVMVN